MVACHTKPWTELTAADLMTPNVVTVRADAAVLYAAWPRRGCRGLR